MRQTFQVHHVYTGYIGRITVNFWTLKDRSLLINIFASNNCFSGKNIFQHASSEIDDAFLTKGWPFHLVKIIWLCSNFSGFWHKHLLWNYKWNFRPLMSAFATVTRNTPLEHQLFSRIFAIKLFHVSVAVANNISSKYFLFPY